MGMEAGCCPLRPPLFCLLWIVLIFPSCFGCIFLADSTNNPEGHSLLKKSEGVHGAIRSILAEDSNRTEILGDGKKEQGIPTGANVTSTEKGSMPEDRTGVNVTKSAGTGEPSNRTHPIVEERGGNSESKQPEEKSNKEKEKEKKSEKEKQKGPCDSAHSCTVKTLLACLRISGDGTQVLSLYLQNEANQVISVKVITPLLWKADPSELNLQNKQDFKTVNLEIKGQIGMADNVTLEVEGMTCSIPIPDQHLDSVMVVQGKGFLGFTYSDAFTPMAAGVYTLLFLVLLGSGAFFYCKWCKRGQRHDDGPKYQELEMGLPNTTRKGKGTRDASIDGWDEVWDDGWDDTDTDMDIAIATPTHTPTSTSTPTTTITITSSSTSSTSVINDAPSNAETARPSPRFLQSLSSKGLATRRVNKDGWDTWDD